MNIFNLDESLNLIIDFGCDIQNQNTKMISQKKNLNPNQQNKSVPLTQEEFNYKYFYIERKLSVNNPKEMPEALNQLQIFLESLLEDSHGIRSLKNDLLKETSKKENTFKLEILNSVVIRLLDLLLNLKHFYLKNKIKSLLIRYQSHMSLVHNKDEICQVLYKSLRGADQYTRIIATKIIPSYWNLFQKDLFAYHYLLEQLMVNRIKIYSKIEKKQIINCLRLLLSKSKYISKLFLNDLDKLVLNITVQIKKKRQIKELKIGQNQNMSIKKQIGEVQYISVRNYGIKPQFLFMLSSSANFQAYQSHKILQNLLQILRTFQFCFKNMNIQGTMLKFCYKFIKKIFLRNLSSNYKLVQLFLRHNLASKLQIGYESIKQVMGLQFIKTKEFIIKNLYIDYQKQLNKILNQQSPKKVAIDQQNAKTLLDYFFCLKKLNVLSNLFNSQKHKNQIQKRDLILERTLLKRENKQKKLQEFFDAILLTYYSQKSYDSNIRTLLKEFLTQNSYGYQKSFQKLLKILLTTGNFKSAKYIIQKIQEQTISYESQNLLFWKSYCQCYNFEGQLRNNISDYTQFIITKLMRLIVLRDLAKQFKLKIFQLLQEWVIIYKEIVIFSQRNTNSLQKKQALQRLRKRISSLEHYYKKSSSYYNLSEEINSLKQVYVQLKNHSSFEKLNQYINQKQKAPYNFNALMKCMYFSKGTIVKIFKELR